MQKLSRVLIFLFSTFLYLSAFSQTKSDLKKQKSELEKEINYTTELLNKTKSNKNKSLNYLKILESQIKSKEQLLTTLNIEISLLSKQIKKTEILILKNKELIVNEEKTLESLKDEYAKMISAAYKQKGSRNNLMFIISSSDFNQAYKRVIYLKQYSAFRKNQALKITETQINLIKNKEKLAQQKDRLIEESATKKLFVSNKKDELKSVNSTKDERQQLVEKLSESEGIYKKQLQDKQKKEIA